MSWTTKKIIPTVLSLLIIHTTTTSALTTARIWTKFHPHCPNPSPESRVGDLDLNEQFGTGLNIHAGTCQAVPVPFSYTPEVNHVSLETDAFWREPREKCRIALYELPGCVNQPLIEEDVGESGSWSGSGRVESRCEERKFAALSQVWVRLDCVRDDEEDDDDVEVSKVAQAQAHNAMVLSGYTNSTIGNSTLSRRRWQPRRRRLSLFA